MGEHVSRDALAYPFTKFSTIFSLRRSIWQLVEEQKVKVQL
nr:MAG TPA: hypothetical protein [Caudoviricetes sp.]